MPESEEDARARRQRMQARARREKTEKAQKRLDEQRDRTKAVRKAAKAGARMMNRKQTGAWMIGGGVVAIVGGLFLPWVTLTAPLVGTLSVYGSEGDGWIVAIAGALGIGAGMLTINGAGDTPPKVLGGISVVGVAAVAVNDFPGLAESVSDVALGRIGVGVYAVVAGGVGLLVGAGTLIFGGFNEDSESEQKTRPMPPKEASTVSMASPEPEQALPDLESRLRELKQLHDDGLIDTEEYVRKQRLLLDGL